MQERHGERTEKGKNIADLKDFYEKVVIGFRPDKDADKQRWDYVNNPGRNPEYTMPEKTQPGECDYTDQRQCQRRDPEAVAGFENPLGLSFCPDID